jgi:hypothetical protein
MSVCVGFLYIENSNFFSSRCILRSRKLIDSCSSFSIVNFVVACSLLNLNKVLFWCIGWEQCIPEKT